MSSSNCCFLTCIQISQEAGQVVWYAHIFKNFLQFVMICTVKGFSVVNEAEVDVFLEILCFFCDPTGVGNFISDSSVFSKSSLNIWKFMIHILLSQDQIANIHWIMEKQIDSKLGKKYGKAVYCNPAYLTYMKSTSCEMPD